MTTEEMLFTRVVMLENELMVTKQRLLVVEQLLEKALASIKDIKVDIQPN
jgi:hypothetical protein